MNINLTKSRQKDIITIREKYKTNPSVKDARYIFDWDDYIEEQKINTQKNMEDNHGQGLKVVFKLH